MQINQKDKRALILCGSFLGITLVYFGLVDPFVLRYDAATENIAKHEKGLSGLKRKKKLLKPRQRKLKSTRAEVEAMLKIFGGKVEPEKRLSLCIGDFQKAAAAAGVHLNSIRPLPATEESHPSFDEYKFELDFAGGYSQILRMLHELEAGKSLLKTRQLDLKQEKDKARCRIMVIRSFYRSKEETPPETTLADSGEG